MIVNPTERTKSDHAISNLKTTTATTTLAASRIGWCGCDILNSADLHSGTCKGTESRLGTRAWGLGTVPWRMSVGTVTSVYLAEPTSSCADLDVESVYAQLLAANCNVLSCQHCGVWRGLVTICLDLHASGDTSDGFAATGITQEVSL